METDGDRRFLRILATLLLLMFTGTAFVYELAQFGIFPQLTPYSVSEIVLTVVFPFVMLGVQAEFRPKFPFFHIGRELGWLGVAVAVSLVALVLGTLSVRALAVLTIVPEGFRPLTMFGICFLLTLGTILCEAACGQIAKNEQKGRGSVTNPFYSLGALVLGIFIYIVASVMLVTRVSTPG